jgi:hypothetical protein
MRKHCRGRDDAIALRNYGGNKPVPKESAYKPYAHRAGNAG